VTRPLTLRLVALLLAVALAVASCVESERACYPSDWLACECANGKPGYQQCDAEGAGYGACDCSGMIPGLPTSTSSGGGSGSGGEGGSDKVGFMEPCTSNEQCETGLCHPFNAKGPHCSLPCGADAECPPPSPGCNNMGVCKAP
jgi:hypothetical protein